MKTSWYKGGNYLNNYYPPPHANVMFVGGYVCGAGVYCFHVVSSSVFFAPVFQWCCSTPKGSPGVGHNTFLSGPHPCFIIVFICDLFVSRDHPLVN